jgi:hypothetical protein
MYIKIFVNTTPVEGVALFLPIFEKSLASTNSYDKRD